MAAKRNRLIGQGQRVVPGNATEDSVLDLLSVSDGRRWSPSTLRYPSYEIAAPRLVSGLPARTVVGRPAPRSSPWSPPVAVAFEYPRQAVECVRRSRRRSVLFAKRKTGKGARSRRRRSSFSGISCR